VPKRLNLQIWRLKSLRNSSCTQNSKNKKLKWNKQKLKNEKLSGWKASHAARCGRTQLKSHTQKAEAAGMQLEASLDYRGRPHL
jgi:hypothetical protein